ncbi:hypothetical protein [Mycobacterium sp.]|uniref:hypothetical protein n=1 Tax=Mycobacterium sp. TaxID=1785 RepID=UPI001280B9E1|nr:hypothetical protein [Mycobacterium sp.]KAA8967519.1 MAG: hypothetical protein F6Q13_06095 [Mycobacterium sp.]
MLAVTSLEIDPNGVRAGSAQCRRLASELSLAAAPSSPAVSTWQATAFRSNIYRADTAKLLALARNRMQSAAAGLCAAANSFERNEAVSASTFRALGNR